MLTFTPAALEGAVVVETAAHRDARGGFARLYCPEAFAAAGIDFSPTQVNLSTNIARHTLRGMHFQHPPHAESKLVRVVKGAVWDVAIDLRPQSPTYRQWTAVTLSEGAMNAIFLPEGVAHGFLTLEPDTHVLYQMGRPYTPGHAAGLRWNDPAFAIAWPAPPAVIADQDRSWPLFDRSRSPATEPGST